MVTSTRPEIAVPDDVMAEVRRKNAEAEFSAFRDLVSERYRDSFSVRIRLLDDPDEDDRRWVVFEVTIPQGTTPDEYSRQIKEFCDELQQRRPHVEWPICVLQLWLAGE